MARGKSNGVGHNSGEPLTDDEAAALQTFFTLKIRAQQRRAAEAKASYDAERNEVNALFSQARGEVRLTRKELEEVMAAQDMTEAEFHHAEAKRLQRLRYGGLPVGTQLELFPSRDTIDDAIDAEANGFRAGRRADDPVPPDYIAGILHPEWMKGYHRGQAVNGEQLAKASEIIAARQAKKPELREDDGGGEADDLDPEAVAAKAKKLKDAGWTEPTDAETQFEDA